MFINFIIKIIMDQEICAICLEIMDDDDNKIKKWNCSHYYHRECINYWDSFCPQCKNNEIIQDVVDIEVTWSICRNPLNVLNIDSMKRNNPRVSTSNVYLYKNLWKDRGCIENNHNILYFQPFGVTVICETCNTIQCFNLLH